MNEQTPINLKGLQQQIEELRAEIQELKSAKKEFEEWIENAEKLYQEYQNSQYRV